MHLSADQLAHLGLLATCLLGVYVGVRTLRIWKRTREVPELAIGIGVLAIALGGVVLTVYVALARPEALVARAALLVGIALLSVHLVATYVGNWKIYRRGEPWAIVLVGFGTGITAFWTIAAISESGPEIWRSVLFLTVRLGAMVWGAIEAFRYSAMLRRRVALGLADPMIAHRICLWGVGAATQTLAITLDLGSWFASGAGLATTPLGLHLTSALGLAGAVTVALAFFPPEFYVRLVVGAAPTSQPRDAS